MANDLHLLKWTDEDFTKAAKDWSRQFLLMPVIGANETLQYMTGLAGIRYKVALPTIEGSGQFAPYRRDRKAADTTDIVFREIETHLGNLRIDFEPNLYISTILGKGAASLGDGQAQAPSIRHVIAAVMQDTARNLNDALFTAKRNPNGDTTAELFDGWGTILDNEITEATSAKQRAICSLSPTRSLRLMPLTLPRRLSAVATRRFAAPKSSFSVTRLLPMLTTMLICSLMPVFRTTRNTIRH